MSLSDECSMSGFTSQTHTHTPEHTNAHGSLHKAARHQRQETKESETALNSMWTCLSLSMVQMVVFTAEASRPTGACIISAIRLQNVLRLFFKTSVHAVGQRKQTSQQGQAKSNALVISKRGSDRRLLVWNTAVTGEHISHVTRSAVHMSSNRPQSQCGVVELTGSMCLDCYTANYCPDSCPSYGSGQRQHEPH